VSGRIEVISDAICPWCFIGKRQMERALPILAAEGLRFSVHWRPFQLNPEMPAAGVERAAYRAAKFGARAPQLDAKIAAAGRAVGLEFRHDLMQRTPNTVDAHRLAWRAEAEGCQDAVVERMFRAYFTEGRDIGDHAVLAELGAECGMDRDRTLAYLAGLDGRAEILAADQAARTAGLDGVPAFALDGHILFTGAVPADAFAEAVREAHRVLTIPHRAA